MTTISIKDLDLYEILGVGVDSDVNEIKKAFRKKALDCHPDKNPDDQKAVEKRFLQLSKGFEILDDVNIKKAFRKNAFDCHPDRNNTDSKVTERFFKLSKALEILCDVSARAAYDKVLKAKKAANNRYRELDSKRQKYVEDLERLEREAQLRSTQDETIDEPTDEEKLQAELTRLDKEGSKLLDEKERVSQQILIDKQRLFAFTNQWIPAENKVKATWYSEISDDKNGGYDEAVLRQYLKKYGKINELIIPIDKKGCALIEFSNREASELAVSFEKGNPENPMSLVFVKNEIDVRSSCGSSSQEFKNDSGSIAERIKRQAVERQRLLLEQC